MNFIYSLESMDFIIYILPSIIEYEFIMNLFCDNDVLV